MVHDYPIPPGKRLGPDGAPLQQYRLYFLDGSDSHITYSHEFEAEDDDHAIEISEAWRKGGRAELWCRARKVKSWEADW